MQDNKVRNRIYRNTFGVFLVVYLVLMIGFSVFLVFQEREAAFMEVRANALQTNSRVGDVLQTYLGEDGAILEDAKAKEALTHNAPLFTPMDSDFTLIDLEVAVFTGDYELFFHTTKDWRIGYTKQKEGNTSYAGYAYLNPADWFDEEEIAEIEGYMYDSLWTERIKELSWNNLELRGFWLDGDKVIPDKIVVSKSYLLEFDEDRGTVSSTVNTNEDETIYHSDYENTRNLPYFEDGYFDLANMNRWNNPQQDALREMVKNPVYLKATALDVESVVEVLKGTFQRIKGLTYRYYIPMPYKNHIRMNMSLAGEEQRITQLWTVVGRDINVGERCMSTLAFVWIACFITFAVAAFILARQAFRTYRQQAELENQRKEMTNALAHDLKTPLSIISGYAENLQENIHTEKRAHYAAYIQANVKRMDQIIRNMLEMGRMETETLRLNLEDMALAEACQTIIERYKPVWEEKEITTSLAGDAVIKGDYSLISRVLDNFFINALDNTPMGERIDIKIGEGKLQIFNSGSFIPEDKISEIWLPFKKGDTARSNSKGTGIGLAIASTILDLHKFSYGAENCEDGIVFWFGY